MARRIEVAPPDFVMANKKSQIKSSSLADLVSDARSMDFLIGGAAQEEQYYAPPAAFEQASASANDTVSRNYVFSDKFSPDGVNHLNPNA